MAFAQALSRFDLPAQPLADSLRAVGSQTNLNVLFDPPLVAAHEAPPLEGEFTAKQAFTLLLMGTGIRHEFLNDRTVVLAAAAAPSESFTGAASSNAPKTPERAVPDASAARYLTTAPKLENMSFWDRFRLAQAETSSRSASPSEQRGSQNSDRNSENRVVQEVLVTARKREERASEIPATVQVFDHTQLEERGVSALVDLQTTIPNFFYATIRPFETPVVMRGLGAPTGGVPGVGLYIDGAYQVDPAAFTLPFYDVERVEVLKGPQGTLYGRNSMAGAINYITRAPSDRFEADLFAELGNGDTYKGAVSLAGPLLGSKILSGRITAGLQRQNGFRDFLDGSDADFDDYDAINARLVLAPSDRFSADLKLSYVEKNNGAYLYHSVSDLNDGNGTLRLNSPFLIGPYAGTRQGSEHVQRAATIRLTYSASAFDVVATSTYDDTENFVLVDIDNIELDLTHSANLFMRDTFSQELRLNSTGEGPLSWLVGAYYTEGTSPIATPRATFVQFANSAPVNIAVGDGEFDGYAVFSDAEYELNDRWVIGAGIRYDSIDKTQVNPTANVLLSNSFSSTQPKVSVKYRFAEDKQVYITAAKGFREGGFNAGLVGTVFENYPMEELWSYEAGLKSTVANGRGYMELAAFYIDVSQFNGSGFVINPIINRPGIVTIPVGAIESYGVELSTSYEFTDAFSMSFSGGYNVAEPTELSPTIQPGQAVVGEQLQNAPKWNVQLTPRLDIPLNNAMTLGLLASVSRLGPTNFRGETSGGAAPQLYERDPFSLIDLRAALEWRNYTISAFVKNATDETYSTSLLPFSLIAPFGATSAAALYNQPRYYGVSLRANF